MTSKYADSTAAIGVILGASLKLELTHHKDYGHGLRIHLTSGSYQAPVITFDMLLQLAAHLGTTTITIDNDATWMEGCPTCGGDMEYEQDWYIYRITKNHPFKSLV
jgi:hypothetical protein